MKGLALRGWCLFIGLVVVNALKQDITIKPSNLGTIVCWIMDAKGSETILFGEAADKVLKLISWRLVVCGTGLTLNRKNSLQTIIYDKLTDAGSNVSALA